MQMITYLNFKGDCEEAFRFYEQHLGGQPGAIFRYAGSPMADTAPPDWADKVMHGSITIGGQRLMAADVMEDQYEEPKGFSLSIHTRSADEAQRIYHELARNGQEVMPLEKTFWAERFGMVVDRFGIRWMINCGEGEEGTP